MNCFLLELLSDLCVSNGEGFGSVIDTDISYDNYGLPIIKGKTLKGCLREAAEELCDIGKCSEDFIGTLFGKPGGETSGILTVYDAHPTNYDELRDNIISKGLRREEVMTCYSYTRGQTRIDEKTGAAKDNSLRITRVLRRGYCFLCEYELRTADEHIKHNLDDCFTLLRHIGLNRTRGLGEVRCTECDNASLTGESHILPEEIKNTDHILYIIHTLSPLIISRSDEQPAYIPSSSVTGLLYDKLGADKMNTLLKEGLSITNAYISDGDKPFYPSPAFLGKQKEAAFGDKGLLAYIFDTEKCGKLDSGENNSPALPLKGMNIASGEDFTEPSCIPVLTEENYHHKQDQNNPGIVDGENFYQLSSVSAMQMFMGEIYGSAEQLKAVAGCLSGEPKVSLGYYKSGGYGMCRIDMRTVKNSAQKTKKETDRAAVLLRSPVILYDDKLMPCADPEFFTEYFARLIGADKETVTAEKKYLRYTQTGGYNVTWGLNKQSFQTYAGGTVFVFRLSEKTDISLLSGKRLGERTAEGYGEFEVIDYNKFTEYYENNDLYIKKSELRSDDLSKKLFVSSNEHKWELPYDIIESRNHLDKILEEAIEKANNFTSINPAQAGRLLLMLKESSDNYGAFKKNADSIKDDAKRKTAAEIIGSCEKYSDDADKIRYLKMLLTQIKYLKRKEKI